MILLVLLLAVAPMFFYKLGESSLVSWDEAWYAEIAKQLLQHGNLLVMRFNGEVFSDHPPFGFWMMAIGQGLFEVNEFGARIAAAVFGLLAVAGVYVLGAHLFNRRVGFLAALAQVSAPWFLLRSRTGNLDIYLVALLVWTVFLAFKTCEQKKYFVPLVVSLACLLLTKTLVPFAIVPVLVVIFGSRKNFKYISVMGLVGAVYWAWTKANSDVSSIFWKRYLSIGTPGVGGEIQILQQVKLLKDNIYNGIGKWFWFSVLGVILGILSRQKRFWVLILMVGCLIAPFAFSKSAQLWHLIPAQPFLLLTLFGLIDFIVTKFVSKKVALVAMVLLVVGVGGPLYARNWREIVDTPVYISDEEILSTEARNYPGNLFIDERFFPVAAYYSDKLVYGVLGPLEEVFDTKPLPYVMITYDWRLARVDRLRYPYEVIKKDRDKILIYRK